MANPETGPEKTVRVLVVDDSAFMRMTLARHLEEVPGISVVGSAHDGQEAIDMTKRFQPDVITLDIEMPHLDGLSALRVIMDECPTPVVMVSSVTAEGARETVQALTLGAVDWIQKPATKANIAVILEDVAAKIKHAAGAQVRRIPKSGALPATPSSVPAPSESKVTRPISKHDKVVVIGSSTGGPFALSTVVAGFPADFPAALLIIQHMPVGFTRSLAERLDSLSPVSIREAQAGDRLEIGKGLLAPGGYHMRITAEGEVTLDQSPTVHGVRPAVDVTMATVAQHFGQKTVATILTGMGRDGTHGCELIHAAGGKVVAEDESTCVVWGMPRSVKEAGIADRIVPLPEIAKTIKDLIS